MPTSPLPFENFEKGDAVPILRMKKRLAKAEII